MKQYAPIRFQWQLPREEEDVQRLSRLVAQLHADAVGRQIQQLPAQEKRQLLEAVIRQVKDASV